MTTTNPYPDIPLPPGAKAISDWEDWGNKFRVVWTEDRRVSGYDCVVCGSAIQFPDGHIDDGTLDETDPPGVFVRCNSAVQMTIDQARELAALIIATAADELEGWVKR